MYIQVIGHGVDITPANNRGTSDMMETVKSEKSCMMQVPFVPLPGINRYVGQNYRIRKRISLTELH